MEKTKGKRIRLLMILAAAVVLCVGLYTGFGPDTCGNSDEDMLRYLESRFGENVTMLKTAQEGNVKAVLYRYKEAWYGGDPSEGFLMVFERRLFGLRWKQTGINVFDEGELTLAWDWNEKSGRFVMEVYGDNRDGGTQGYSFDNTPELYRDGLASDYILDIYIMNGVHEVSQRPGGFQVRSAAAKAD